MSVHRGGRGPGHMVRTAGKAGDGAASAWILTSGAWNDAGVWDDTAVWKDA